MPIEIGNTGNNVNAGGGAAANQSSSGGGNSGVQNTSDATAGNTGNQSNNPNASQRAGADTDAANQSTNNQESSNQNAGGQNAQNARESGGGNDSERRFTQAEVNQIIQQRLPKAVKAELKRLSGEAEGMPTVDDLQRELNEERHKTRRFESRDSIAEFLQDGRNKLNVRAENVRGITELVLPHLTFDDDGKPDNLREAVERAKSIAPTLFVSSTNPNINQNGNRNAQSGPVDMNRFIRDAAGIQ